MGYNENADDVGFEKKNHHVSLSQLRNKASGYSSKTELTLSKDHLIRGLFNNIISKNVTMPG